MVIAIIAILVLLLLPAINAAREAARRNGCLSNIRQLGLATFNHESTLKRYPPVSQFNDPTTGDLRLYTPGSETLGSDDYSWIVRVLPYMEEDILYDEIRKTSAKFQTPAFAATVGRDSNGDGSISATGMAGGDTHLSAVQVPSLQCPSYSGPDKATLDGTTDYESAAGNYVAVVGTDTQAKTATNHKAAYNNWENGGMASAWGADSKGMKVGELGDGTAKTILYAESKDEYYNSWFSAACTWVVGVSNNAGTVALGADGFVTLPTTESLALDYGDEVYYRDPSVTELYMPANSAGEWAGSEARVFGPSSEHGGLVHHAFADGHAQSINVDVDAQTYLRFITRSDGDPAEILE